MKKNKLLITVASVCAALGMTALAACGGGYKLEKFVVDTTNFTDYEYEVGETVDFSVLDMYATFTDDSKSDVALKDVSIYLDGVDITGNLQKITETTGEKTIVIKYATTVGTQEFTFAKKIKVVEKGTAVIPQVQTVTMDYSGVQTLAYEVGATNVSLAGLVVKATYDNDTEKTVELTDEKLSIYCGEEKIPANELNKIAATPGTKTITVNYDSVVSNNFFTIEVSNPLTGITLNKTSYAVKVGDTLNLSDLMVSANYKYGAAQTVTDVKYYVNGAESDLSGLTATAGAKTVTVKYQDKEASFTVNVANFVTAISVDATNANLNFVVDGVLSADDFASVKVNVTYADNTDATVSKQLALSADGVTLTNELNGAVDWAKLTATSGDKTINVSYAGKTTSFVINVDPRDGAVKQLVITEPTVKTFTAGGAVSMDGLSVTVKYKEEYNQDDETVAFADFASKEVKLFDAAGNDVTANLNKLAEIVKVGDTTVPVKVKYENGEASFNITVSNPVQSLTLNTDEVKKAYKFGETVSLDGLVVTANLTYGSVTVEDATVSDISNLTASLGEKTVTVSYAGKSASFDINVTDYVVLLTANQTSFSCDVLTETVTFDGLVLTATYASGATKDVTASATNDASAATPGAKEVTFTYEEGAYSVSTKVSLQVNNVLTGISVSGYPTYTAHLKAPDLSGITVKGTYKYGDPKQVQLFGDDKQPLLEFKFQLQERNTNAAWTTFDYNNCSIIASEAAVERNVRLVYEGGEAKTPLYAEFSILIGEQLRDIKDFTKPEFVVNYEALKAASKAKPDAEGTFFNVKENDYVVGDDNAFRFVPELSFINYDAAEGENATLTLDNFYASSTIYLVGENTETELTRKAAGTKKIDGITSNVFEYSLNGTVYVTEYAHVNQYDFADGVATGKAFKLSVLPNSDEFEYGSDINAQSFVVNVVDGYNIYNSNELCILDNSGREEWAAYRARVGLTGVNPNGVILHGDTMVGADSLPDEFKYTLADDYAIMYKDANENKGKPEDFGLTRTFVWNQYKGNFEIFEHYLSAGQTFNLYGNYFSLDTSKFPLVASFDANGQKDVNGNVINGDAWYGDDFSNTSLLKVMASWAKDSGQGNSIDQTTGEQQERFNFYNLNAKGNAKSQQLVVTEGTTGYQNKETLVYGGGLIFVKVEGVETNYENVLTNNFFISLYAEYSGKANYNYVKCYDSFQDAIFAFGGVEMNFANSHLKRAGGPLIIMNHPNPDKAGYENYYPTINIDEATCQMEAFLAGTEVWFEVVGATAMIEPIKSADALFNNFRKTILKDGKMNIIALLMRDGANAKTALGAYQTQGLLNVYNGVDDEGNPIIVNQINRMDTAKWGNPDAPSSPVKQVCMANAQINPLAPVFSVGESAIYLDPSDSQTLRFLPHVDTPEEIGAVQTAFGHPNSNQVVYNMLGLSLMFGYYSLG